MANPMDLRALEADPRLFLYTSLTAGSSHIITATSRMETILKANKIPFVAIDTATDEKARRLWQRRAGGKKLPGLVKEGFVIGDLQEVEEWNEFGELKENIGPVPASNAAPPEGGQLGVNLAPPLPVVPTATAGSAKLAQPSDVNKAPKPILDESKMRPLPGAAEIAARNKKPEESSVDEPPKVETVTSAPEQKEQSIKSAADRLKAHPNVEHLSAPASRIHSGTATPVPEPAAIKADETPAAEATEEEEKNKEEEKEDSPTKADDQVERVAEKVEGLQVGEGTKTQEQSAKEGDDATKSVED